MVKNIWVLSMFDSYFDQFTEFGVIGQLFRGDRGGDIDFKFHAVSIAQFNKKGFKGVDDSPYGGGVGMIIRPDILKEVLIEGVVKPGGYKSIKDDLHIVCPAPRGKTWTQELAMDFAERNLSKKSKDLVFICGRYEGIDERFLENYVNEYISLGDYILTGGELATMVILDSALRFSSGVLGNKLSATEESFFNNKLEHALYTKPFSFEDKEVPEALKSGHHQKILEFREESSEKITIKYRPDLKDK